MRRRELIVGLGASIATWPLAARAQQATNPIIGYLYSGWREPSADYTAAFRQGLSESGYIESHNVTIEYRYADGQFDLLPMLAADLVRRKVAVMLTPGDAAALAAKAATTTIPIVFTVGTDPVATGLVGSLNRPGGNATGVSQLGVTIVPKLLDLLHQLVPTAVAIGVLANPHYVNSEHSLSQAAEAARILGVQLHVLAASSDGDLDMAFAAIVQRQIRALVVLSDIGFMQSRMDRIVKLAARHSIPAIYNRRIAVAAGGLMSYDTPLTDAYRIAGGYVGRILGGQKPAELPVQQSTKVELIINMKAAKALGLTVPLTLRSRANEVIE
jgi:putative tryptophan/tyrosine transport system substrate-binding protein